MLDQFGIITCLAVVLIGLVIECELLIKNLKQKTISKKISIIISSSLIGSGVTILAIYDLLNNLISN